MAAREQIKAGTITLLGGMRFAGVVSGPKEPVIHLHGAIGRDTTAVVGCVRRDSSVYIVVEAVIAEIIGIDARRELSEKTGGMMLELNDHA